MEGKGETESGGCKRREGEELRSSDGGAKENRSMATSRVGRARPMRETARIIRYCWFWFPCAPLVPGPRRHARAHCTISKTRENVRF